MKDDLSALDTALSLLGHGLWPIATHPRGVIIRNKEGPKVAEGKEPIGEAWGIRKPTEAKLRATYRDHPGAGVGIRLGPDGGVIDLEVDGPDGEESLIKLMGGEIVPTLGWSSRRGPHHLFRYNPRLKHFGRSVIKLPELPGLEIRTAANRMQ